MSTTTTARRFTHVIVYNDDAAPLVVAGDEGTGGTGGTGGKNLANVVALATG